MKSFRYEIIFTRADGAVDIYISGGANEDEAIANFYHSTVSRDHTSIIGVNKTQRKPEFTVRTLYQSHIEFRFDVEGRRASVPGRSERVNDFAFEITKNVKGLDVENAGFGPCHYAYVVLTSEDKQLVELYSKAIITYIKTFRGHHVEAL